MAGFTRTLLRYLNDRRELFRSILTLGPKFFGFGCGNGLVNQAGLGSPFSRP